MKISYNWLKSVIALNKTPEEVDDLLTSCGLEVEGISEFESIPGGLKGLVIGQVLEKEKHPDADRLSLTKVDIGGPEILSIVCGAPNVEVGQKVIVAPVDCVLCPTNGEPFTIKKSKIRGQLSEGMICADDEIGLGESHDGIRVLPEDAEVGTLLNDYLKIENDFVLEIGLTPNRGDAASVLGVARDLKALTGVEPQVPVLMPLQGSGDNPIDVEVQNTEGCPRYAGVFIKGVQVGPSPEWIQNRLKAIGIKPKNNIVDCTNYVLHDLGQPIHAFDADDIEGKIIVRNAQSGESITTLDDVTRKLNGYELLICDEKKPLALAGVFGGKHCSVKDTTVNVFIESAYFNPATIRKTAKAQGLNTDASFRYERGTDPSVPLYALRKVANLIIECAGGHVAGSEIDVYPTVINDHDFEINTDKIRALSGANISDQEIENILTGLEITIQKEAINWKVKVPARKHDVTRQIDLVEEILRIYGYDNIPFKKDMCISGNTAGESYKHNYRFRIASYLADNGFNEILSNSLSNTELQHNPENSVVILNPLSNDLGVLRDNMMSTALEAVAYNKHRKNHNLKFFEFGKVYSRIHEKYNEEERLFILVTGNRLEENWHTKTEPAGYFYVKALVENILSKLGRKTSFKEIEKWVNMDKVPNQWLKKYDLKSEIWFADIAWGKLLSFPVQKKFEVSPVPKFPEVRRDLSLVLAESVLFKDIESKAYALAGSKLQHVNLFDVYVGKPLEEGKKAYSVSFSLYDDEKTLTEKEIDHIMKKLMDGLEKDLGAFIRK